MVPTNGKKISVRLMTHTFLVCAGLVLAGCGSQKGPTTSGANSIPLQIDYLTNDQDTTTLDGKNFDEPVIATEVEGDETSLLATETIDPEADETAVTIVILPQKRDTDIETLQNTSDGQTVADAPPKVEIESSDETKIATFKRTFHPNILVGMTALEVKTKIGPADFIRHEGSVITWQYRVPACVIDLFIPYVGPTWREAIANARIDNMQISGTYIRSRIHGTSLKETECLSAFSERRQAAH